MGQDVTNQRGSSSGITIALILFVVAIGIGTWAAYTYGEGHIIIDGRTVSELEPWEVVGGVVMGIFGLLIGLFFGLFGLLIGLVATVLSLVMAFIGVAAGLFITAGVLLGPFLLLAAIILLMRTNTRQKKLEEESAARGGAEMTSTNAAYWT